MDYIKGYTFSAELDAVFAFASLIHVPKESLQKVFQSIYDSLDSDGVFRLSMKHAEEYKEDTKTDKFGTRTYYLYSDKDIEERAQNFTVIKNKINNLRGQAWLEVLLQK